MSDEVVAALVALPNIGIAVWMLWQQGQTIKVLLENQQNLIEQLMKLHPPQTVENAAKIAGDRGS